MRNAGLKKEFEEHVSKYYWEVEDDEDFPSGRIVTQRKDKSGAIKITFADNPNEPVYFYKGYEIERWKTTPNGYYGAWRVVGGSKSPWSDSLTHLVQECENRIVERAKAG